MTYNRKIEIDKKELLALRWATDLWPKKKYIGILMKKDA
jgi:hypothetical protein